MKDSMTAPATAPHAFRESPGALAEVIPLFPGAMLTPDQPTRWSRLRDALPPALTDPHITVALRVAAAADGLHRLASRLSSGQLPADPAGQRADLLVEYARSGGDVAGLATTRGGAC